MQYVTITGNTFKTFGNGIYTSRILKGGGIKSISMPDTALLHFALMVVAPAYSVTNLKTCGMYKCPKATALATYQLDRKPISKLLVCVYGNSLANVTLSETALLRAKLNYRP